MKINKFKYNKKDEVKEYNLLVLNESETHVSGIDLNKLTPEESVELLEVQKDYELRLRPFMNSFRQFIKTKIVEG